MSAPEQTMGSTLRAIADNALPEAERLEREADEYERKMKANRQEATFLRALHGAASAYQPERPVMRVVKEVTA